MRLSSLAGLVPLFLATAACSVFLGPERPDLVLELDVVGASEESAVDLAMDVLVGGRLFRVEAGRDRRVEVKAPDLGNLPVEVVLLSLLGGASDTLAATRFTHTFRDGRDHWVVGDLGVRRPLGHCIGELTVLPLAGVEPDTLFLMHGSIPKDAVC